jgi:hypothetical protein
MPARYARIPGVKILATILQSIPVKLRLQPGLYRNMPSPPTKYAQVISKTSRCKPLVETQVYVLELHGGFIYVGQSNNVQRRIQQHMSGHGAMFTKRHKPTGIVLSRLGTINGAGDSGERQEVLLQMRMHGMEAVRGWKYVNNTLSKSDVLDITSNWVEMFNLCRMCKKPGHMASACKIKNKRVSRILIK